MQFIATWILAGKPATMLLPLILIALVVSLIFAVLRDRTTRNGNPSQGRRTQQPPVKRPREENW